MKPKKLLPLVGVQAVSAAIAVMMGGCGNPQADHPLSPEAFLQPPVAGHQVGNPVDRPGAIPTEGDRILPPRYPSSPPPVVVGRTVRESVQTPDVEASREAARLGNATTESSETSQPTTHMASNYGFWFPIGSVLMEVNGTAIFSDKVIGAIEKPLIAEARKGGQARFRRIAQELFENQIHVYERDELEYASAQRGLEPADEQTARGMTAQWRQRKITEAGGSLEVAARRAAADGWDFDKQVEQQFRLYLVQIYYQKRIIPLINVQPADIRKFYDQHKESDFTTHGQAKFRVIKIDLRQHGGKERAIDLARDVVKRAATEDFGAIARDKAINDEAAWVSSAGVVGGTDGFVQKGAFRVPAVEDAVWKLKPGQCTVVDNSNDDGCLYIVKLEQLTEDKVQDFASLEVQEKIRETLRSQQFSVLRERHISELLKDAVTQRNDQAIEDALASIIQQYPQWAGK